MAAEFEFVSELTSRTKGIDLFHFEEIDKDYDYSYAKEAIITWKLVIDKRVSGIEGMYPIISSVKFTMDYETEDGEEKTYKITIQDNEEGWGIEDEIDEKTDRSFYPQNIQLDFKDKQVYINF